MNTTKYYTASAATVAEAMSWCENLLNKKVGSGQCVALIQSYYEYLGKSRSYGNACDYATNTLPSGWSRVKGGVPQAGDILVYVGAKYGHVAIYAGGTTSYHQNMKGLYVEKKTNWAYNKSWYSSAEGGTKSYWGYIRPNFGSNSCNCSGSYAGNYTCTSKTTLNIRNGHSTSASVVGSIPSGATVYVSKSDGTWAHVEYNGVKGYASMTYLSKVKEPDPTPTEIRGSEMKSGYDRVLPDGNYIIASAANPQYFLDIEGGTYPAVNGTNVTIYNWGTELAKYDTWTITYRDGFYRITQNGTGMSLDVLDADTLQEKNVQVWGNNDSAAQKWAISGNGRNGYRIQAKCSGYSLDIAGGKLANGTNVRQYSANNSGAQDWIFIPYKPAQTLAEGRYVLLSDMDRSMELDVAGDTGDIPNETNVQIWKNTAPSRYNSFDVVKGANGYYKLIHAASGKALDLYNGGTGLQNNISLHDQNGNIAQDWAIISEGRDSYVIWSRRSGMVMDVEYAKTANGTNVSQCTYNGGANQKWHFVRAEHSVTYNLMGGQDGPEKQTKYYMSDLKLSSTVPKRKGYVFKGWNSSSGYNGKVYQAGSTYSNDADITLYAAWVAQGSEMTSGYDRVLPDGDYVIASSKNSVYYLDISGKTFPAANGTNVSLCGPISGEVAAYDIWTITYKDGFYKIVQKGTDMALAVAGGDTLEKANIQVNKNDNSAGQKWAISRNGRNGYRIQSKCSGYSVDIADGTIENGRNVRQYSSNNSGAQDWLFIPYKPAQTLKEERYILLSDIDRSIELDVFGNSGDIPNETNVQIWKNTTQSRYNSFDVVKAGNGYYKLIHAASGKALDLYKGKSELRSNISLHDQNGDAAQNWAIISAGGGSYVLWSKRSGMVMDVENAKTANGTNVSQSTYTGGANQRWYFVPAEYAVTYNLMGGQGGPEKQTKYYMADLKLSSTVPQREGYTFKGWNDSENLKGNMYQPGNVYTKDGSLTLYAVWERNYTPLLSVVQDGEKLTATISNMDNVVEYGFVCGKGEDVTLETPGRVRMAFTELTKDNTFVYEASKAKGYAYRAYAKYMNENGEEEVVYSEHFFE